MPRKDIPKALNLKLPESVLRGMEKRAKALPIPTTRNKLIVHTLTEIAQGAAIPQSAMDSLNGH